MAPFSDIRLQFGIKMALAGLLAYYTTLVLRLYDPVWCLLTVMIVMLAKYVGAIAEKSVLRMIGTVIGGIIGVILVGDYVGNPLFFLVTFSLIVGYCTYRFGGTFYPYAFFLCALTLIVIATNAVNNPNVVAFIALSRIEEILIGTMSATLVSALLWPNYARMDFLKQSQQFTFRVGTMITGLIRDLQENVPAVEYTGEQQLLFLNNINHLRMVIQAGSRESIYFKARIGTYTKVTGILAGLHESARDLAHRRYDKQLFVQEMGTELDAVYEALKAEFAVLSAPRDDETSFPPSTLHPALEKLDARLDVMQKELTLRNYPLDEVLEFGHHLVALRRIGREVRELRELLESLPTMGTNLMRTPDEPKPPAHIDPFWVKNGIKGALAAIAGLVLCRWLNPPGAGFIPLFAWVFTVMSRGFLGGVGDRRCFQYVFLVAAWGIPVGFLILILAPYLVSYIVFNLVLFTALCIFGFSIAKTIPSVSYLSFMALNVLVAVFGLNFQQPVSFQDVLGSYIGTVVGLLISAIIQRTIWPILPQMELRDRFVEFFRDCQSLLSETFPNKSSARYRIAMIPCEAASWAKVMTYPFAPEGEAEKLTAFNSTLSRLAHELLRLQEDKKAEIPDTVKPRIHPVIQNMETELQVYFKNCMESFKNGIKPLLGASLEASLANLKTAIAKVREDSLLVDQDVWPVLSYLALVNRYESLAESVEDCEAKTKALSIEKYWGDYHL
ncbi:MAG: FUSC family protein [Chthoniobacterales bacterium]